MKKILLILAATVIAVASLFGLANITDNQLKMKAEEPGIYSEDEPNFKYTLEDNGTKKYLTEINFPEDMSDNPEETEEFQVTHITDKSKDYFFRIFDTNAFIYGSWYYFKKNRDYEGFDKINVFMKKESGEELVNDSFDIGDYNSVNFLYQLTHSNFFYYDVTINKKSIANVQKQLNENEKVLFKLFFSKSDANAPVITGQKVWLANIDNPISVEEIKSHLIINDEVDGVIDSSKLTVKEDNFTKNNKVIGNYNVTFSVKDKAQNEALYTIVVQLKDLKKPTISSTKENYRIGYKEELDLETVKNNITVTDNYDKGTLEAELINNTYQSNKSNLGTYTLEFKAVDTSGNEARKSINVEVYDNVKPIMTFKAIKTSYRIKITLADILENVTITDEKDTEITKAAVSLVSETYSSKFDKVGNYQFILKGKDKYNNETQIAVPVEVYDDVAPVITTDEYFIALDQFQLMTIQEIIDFMKSKNLLDSNFELSNHTIIEDNYTASNFIPGMHFVKMQNNETGKEIIINIDTKKADTTDINENTNQNTTSDLIKNQWNNVKDFLVKNWVYIVSGLGGLILLAIIIRIAVGGRRRRW